MKREKKNSDHKELATTKAPKPTQLPKSPSTPKSIVKTVQKKEELYIQFTPEEMEQLGIKPHDLFEIDVSKDGDLILTKGVEVDLEIGQWERETLEWLISASIEQQLPVDEIIRQVLTEKLKPQS